ncbi:hypothetical protein F2Q70_00011357 [Brassica cretica]|uniref:Thylakoid soluble phosphoprotein TSP9 n=5 Tax=Brassica TaxID=3705 RepID=A0A3N6QTQ0_BRACR|nr:PREDICTED: uncharacterized protein LOC106329412 [Brassica oleracea var. oleracea]KAF2579462.1 hypothetical protein F2Q68_00004493 [Brassica cretica]KAG2293049.1 hypothetical protein Bca52824_039718 [Brassica carinata]VDC96372.1 unnamed protein product [Brassica oleracea]KAF2612629.1 hypothetical protein F2Q70_00011357 [Brassica cretica]KAF3506489.1 hypothetical protein F2Q69_00005839 [Brassica cretica]
MVSSLLMSFAPATVRAYATTAKGASGGAKEEKNPLDFVLGYLTKQDQFYETDPILKKVEKEQGTTGGRGTVRGGGKSAAPVPVAAKKNDGGGFGGLAGLFNKK